jgi:NAD-dependent deacetylase
MLAARAEGAMTERAWESVVDAALADDGELLVLTGAGISAESGIPTFRGPEGYWTVGSEVYAPTELATQAMFRRAPEQVWAWYLYRRGVCHAATPNEAHFALAELGARWTTRALIVTQNVDGLHLRAGSSPERTYQVHGNLDLVRCADECHPDLAEVPHTVAAKQPGEGLTRQEARDLRCDGCGGWLRPHVLWFDEYYDEERYRFDSSLGAAAQAALLVTVGTSGATNLPNQIVRTAVGAGAALVDVNPEANPFGDVATRLERGAVLRERASEAVPALVARLLKG